MNTPHHGSGVGMLFGAILKSSYNSLKLIPNLAIGFNYSTLGSVFQVKIWSAYKGLAEFFWIGRVWVGAAGVANSRVS
jgi:hypothetical protein